MTCEEVRLTLGAHALGALDPDEALQVDLHLATCEVCGAELLELEGVSAFLGKVSERDVELVASPPRQVLDRLLNARAKRHRRGRVLLAVAASVAVLAVGGTVWTASARQASQEATSAAAPAPETAGDTAARADQADQAETKIHIELQPSPLRSASPRETSGREFPGANEARGYYAHVAAFPGEDGTRLAVRVAGVPVGTTCRLVVVGRNGEREVTESWTVSRETYQDKVVFPRHTRIPMADIARFDLVDGADRVLVRVKVTPRK
ncbi:zf-HC2 domain-containing protein [Nonomuraea sp. NPDC048916]|uniref:anti-sigma factor family protein n=1 Tax=Nonomuraea sp. NPDC048916 TaxID=3154232 RepID=UPI0033D126C2